MAPFEMLYGRRCRTPLFWSETGERKVFGPDILQEAEKQVRLVRENLRVTQSRHKSYVDHRRRELSFEVGDFVRISFHLGNYGSNDQELTLYMSIPPTLNCN